MNLQLSSFCLFIEKALDITEKAIASRDIEFAIQSADNRERLVNLINAISTQIKWEDVAPDLRSDLNRKINYLLKLDEQWIQLLQELSLELKENIQITVKNKECIKGYNLNDTK